MRPLLLPTCAVALALAVPAAAQGSLLVVDAAAGPGYDYTEIADAVAAAGEGDALLVRDGIYAAFTVTGKSLLVVEDEGADARVRGTLAVSDLGPDQLVLLRGLRNLGPNAEGIVIERCAGSVWLEDCTLVAREDGEPGARVEDAEAVELIRTLVRGRSGSGGFSAGFGDAGGAGLDAQDARVHVWRSVLVGESGGDGDDIGGPGGNGLLLERGFAFVAGSRLVGGAGGGADDDFDIFCGCTQCGAPGAGGSALRADAGFPPVGEPPEVVTLDDVLAPGAGGITLNPVECFDGPAGLALEVTAPATELAGRARAYRAAAPVREGAPLALTLEAEPGELAALLVSFAQAPVLVEPFAGVLLPADGLVILNLGAVPASGVLELAPAAPELPAGVPAVALFTQAVFLAPDGGVWLGDPSALLLLDAAL